MPRLLQAPVVEETGATAYARLKESAAVSLGGVAPSQSIVVAEEGGEEDRLALVVEETGATVYARLKESVAVSLDGVE